MHQTVVIAMKTTVTVVIWLTLLYFENKGIYTPILSPPFENVTAATDRKDRYDLFFLSCTTCLGGNLSFFLISIRFLTPITIGIIPISPMIYVGTTNENKEPRALMAISKPIPIY